MTEIDGARDRSGISTNRNVANLSTYRETSQPGAECKVLAILQFFCDCKLVLIRCLRLTASSQNLVTSMKTSAVYFCNLCRVIPR